MNLRRCLLERSSILILNLEHFYNENLVIHTQYANATGFSPGTILSMRQFLLPFLMFTIYYT